MVFRVLKIPSCQCSSHRAALLLSQPSSTARCVLREVTYPQAKPAVITHPPLQLTAMASNMGHAFSILWCCCLLLESGEIQVFFSKIYKKIMHFSALTTHAIQRLCAPCWAPRHGYTPQPHLFSVSWWKLVRPVTLIPSTTCLFLCQQSLLLFQEFKACQ